VKALVVGGTGPSGPFLVNGLIERGYEVTIFHRGTHEIPEIPAGIEHIHGDPHFTETISEAVGKRTFDVVIATYGRIRFIAEALEGKTGHFLGIGGVPSYRGYFHPSINFPPGLPTPTPEDAPLVASEEEHRFSYLIKTTEDAVLRSHPRGTVFRYPYVYGPYQLVPREWSIIRRILDRRPFILLPASGMTLMTHGYAGNLAHAVLLAVDKPDIAAGQIYNCGDDQQFTLRQVVEVISRELSHDWEILGLPDGAAAPLGGLTIQGTPHHRLMDLSKIQAQLGYRDQEPPAEAIARSARWYVQNQPEPGGEIEQRLQDKFDYATEDKLAAILRDGIKRMEALSSGKLEPMPHPYAHPKEPNLQRDHRGR
jgi:nucleoside-diphosphate-sugar epimerase